MEMLLWLIYPLLFIIIQTSSTSTADHLCNHDESLALLQFKQMFTITNETSKCDEFLQNQPKMMFWNTSKDCCSWDGVTCNSITGHVIGLDLSCSGLSGTIQPNSSLNYLTHLQKLNLASNDLSGPYILREVSMLKSLKYLNLSDNYFSNVIPGISRFSNLTKLRVLSLASVDLSSELPVSLNFSTSLVHLDLQLTGLSGELPDVVFHLPNLDTLILSNNMDLTGNLLKFNWNASHSLKYFDLSHTSFYGKLHNSISFAKCLNYLVLANCHFFGSIPESIGNLTFISKIDLSFNNFSGYLPSTISNLEQLNYLDLSLNNFEGKIPDVFHHLRRLTFLQLGVNHFSGGFPSSVVNLSELTILDLNSNSLKGPLPQIAYGLQKLTYFSISNNSLNGTIPSWLFSLSSLKLLALDHNQLIGKIHDFKSPSQLNAVLLSNNKLNGSIPKSISNLNFLNFLVLSSNNLSGIVELSMLPSSIYALDISYNNLIWSNQNRGNVTLPILISLKMSSCNINEFPHFLRYSTYLEVIDLSNNKLRGEIPDWFISTQFDYLGYLDLSHNYLTNLEYQFPWNLQYLRLKSNLFRGPLPSHICNFQTLTVLDLSDNKFSGTIPESFVNSSDELVVLDLRRNELQGTIPTSFPKGNQLRNLGLNGNKLDGPLPRSLLNCQELEVLDLGNNNLIGEFPYWLENLRQLQVLILKSNRLNGTVSRFKTRFPFPNLRILDLSHNQLIGILPENLFRSFKAMINSREHEGEVEYMEMKDANYMYYQDSLALVVKGTEIEFSRVLTILTAIDFSSNEFEGEIPRFIGELNSLRMLNLSHNKLNGHIPSVFGNLSKLESLDLSWNQFEGQIPWQLTKLSSLSVLNLSQNHLTGRIPEGNQFHTFGNDSYSGNLALCGFPLTKICGDSEASQPPSTLLTFDQEEDDSDDFFSGFSWKPVVMGYTCGMVLGLAIGYTMFYIGKPKWFCKAPERKYYK
ncbi:hypothetical protein ACH5RR_009517 [Cinchona calisaya]|uniref:Leucine-rich repeat-containing N-terminal plant-type domain-containing protein n=1 Tax=Cinchona calisaya TaxID=153742 RepID=A0ABD3AED3_9GENT